MLNLSAVSLDIKAMSPSPNWTVNAGNVQPLALPKLIPNVIASAEQQTAVMLPKPRCFSQRWLHPALLFVTVQQLYMSSTVSQDRSGHVSSKKHQSAQSASAAEKNKIKLIPARFNASWRRGHLSGTPHRYQNYWQLWTALTSQQCFEVSAALTGGHCRQLQRSESVAENRVSMATMTSGGRVGREKKMSWLSEKFKPCFDWNSHATSGFCVYGIKVFFRPRSWRFYIIRQPIFSSCYS